MITQNTLATAPSILYRSGSSFIADSDAAMYIAINTPFAQQIIVSMLKFSVYFSATVADSNNKTHAIAMSGVPFLFLFEKIELIVPLLLRLANSLAKLTMYKLTAPKHVMKPTNPIIDAQKLPND